MGYQDADNPIITLFEPINCHDHLTHNGFSGFAQLESYVNP